MRLNRSAICPIILGFNGFKIYCQINTFWLTYQSVYISITSGNFIYGPVASLISTEEPSASLSDGMERTFLKWIDIQRARLTGAAHPVYQSLRDHCHAQSDEQVHQDNKMSPYPGPQRVCLFSLIPSILVRSIPVRCPMHQQTFERRDGCSRFASAQPCSIPEQANDFKLRR
jgi:nitrite reductase/ring-hydroxylating ferredoxin subunit